MDEENTTFVPPPPVIKDRGLLHAYFGKKSIFKAITKQPDMAKAAVRDVYTHRLGESEAAKKYGVSLDSIRRWVSHLPTGLSAKEGEALDRNLAIMFDHGGNEDSVPPRTHTIGNKWRQSPQEEAQAPRDQVEPW